MEQVCGTPQGRGRRRDPAQPGRRDRPRTGSAAAQGLRPAHPPTHNARSPARLQRPTLLFKKAYSDFFSLPVSFIFKTEMNLFT